LTADKFDVINEEEQLRMRARIGAKVDAPTQRNVNQQPTKNKEEKKESSK
jgi:hypothetical protein